MHKFFLLAFLLFTTPIVVLAQLDDTQVIDREIVPASDVSLSTFTSCDAMDTVLTKYFKSALQNQLNVYGNERMYMESMNSQAAPMADGIWGGGGLEADFSVTNTQIENIDESEVVKTDGKFLYYASNQPDDSGFQYVYIAQSNPFSLVKRIKLPDTYTGIELYLADNKLVILANKWAYDVPYIPTPVSISDASSTVVIVYDITDPKTPVLDRFYTLRWHLAQSRRDGDYLYVLSQNYVSFNIWWNNNIYSREEIDTYFDTKFDPQTLIPQGVDMKRWVPGDSQIQLENSNYGVDRDKIPCTEIEYILPEKPTNTSFVNLSIIPLKNLKEDVKTKVIYGDVAQFFMSEKSFYIVSNYSLGNGGFDCPINARCIMPFFRNEYNSVIHRFSTENHDANYVYSLLTPGMPLSQYAMHEQNGVLFSAHQKDWTTNGVDVFAIDTNGKLLSKLENVGAEERFQAARYADDRLYLVTFEQVDPLFVIDIKNPSKMSILGELIMPGYSTYLHPYDKNHLIGIGYDTVESQWWGTMNAGIKVDLYDVTDVLNPKQKFSQVYGGIGSSSDALWNPKSLIWDANKKILLFPVQLMDQNQTTYQYKYAWQGLLALKIDKDAGISEETRISHIDMTGIAEKRKEACAQYARPVPTEQCYTHIVTGEKICLSPDKNPANADIPTYCYAEFDDSSYLANSIWEMYPFFIQRALYVGNALYTFSPSYIKVHTYGSGYGEKGRVELRK